MTSPSLPPEASPLVAQLLAEAVRAAQGQPGVLVRDVPHLDPGAVLAEFAGLIAQDVDLRIAYLNPTAHASASAAGINGDNFTTKVEQAEVWRNTRGLDALVVVIAEVDAAKLTSLEDFAPAGPGQLRRFLVDRAIVKFSEPNEVLPRWWEIIGVDDQMSFSDLVDYFLILRDLEGAELRDEAALQINRLGLLPDPTFFDGPSERQLRKRLADNRTIALRLANFSEEDRQRVDKVLLAETDEDRRAVLRQRLRDLQEYRRGGQLNLTADDARQLLNVKRTPPQPPQPDPPDVEPPPPPPPPLTLTGLAIENLLRDEADDHEDSSGATLDNAVAELREQVTAIDDSTVRPEPISVSLPGGTQVDDVVSTDVVNMVNRLVGEGLYGAFVRSTGHDIDTLVRGFHQSAEVLRHFKRSQIDEFLDAFATVSPEGAGLRDAFGAYDESRNALLPHLGELCAAPLLVATAPTTRALITPVIDAYRAVVTSVTAAYSTLHTEFGDDARTVTEMLMLIDTVVLDSGSSLVALLTPLHPLLLWHYAEYAHVIESQKDLLDVRDRDLVRSEFQSGGVPFFFSSLGIPRSISESVPTSLPFSGRFGGLPHFSVRADARDLKDGAGPIRRLIEAFVAMHPAAAEGLRLGLLEPPEAGVYLSMCCDLAEAGTLRGGHITVLRRGSAVGAELNLSGDEERRVQQRFGNHADRRFTFETRRIAPNAVGVADGLIPHLLVVFDQTDRQVADAGAPLQTIQPLANRRRLVYRIATHNLDLEPALGGILAEYSSMAKLAVGTQVNSYATMHQSEQLESRFKNAAQQVPWYVIADGHVDRDLGLDAMRVLTDRERTRDVVAFARSPAAFRRSLRDVVRQFNTSVSDDKLDALLHELSDLLDAGLLSLRPGRSGETVQSHVRGLLGLLVSVEALREMTPPGHDRVILSLDSDQARRWLHLADDPHRADLLVIDGADDRFTVTVVEVKTRQDTTSEYTVSGGKVTGPAITQLLSTHELMRQLFDPEHPELLVTPSRREILRDHLYRELSKVGYDGPAKQRWAKRSEQLFDGTPDIDLRCALIEVRLGVSSAGLAPRQDAQAGDDDHLVPVLILDLNEDGVSLVEEALAQPEGGEPRQDGELGDGLHSDERMPGARPTPTEDAAGPSLRVTEPEPGVGTARPRVMVGHGTAKSGPQREVWFDPQNPERSLNNPHVSISGETGSGKTQATKALLHELLPQGLPALILDFKDDYSKGDYAAAEGFTVHDANFGSLPFNPMVPPVDPESGRANPTGHVHELANMIQRIYRLGDQQAFTLREAMKETYSIAGVGDRPFVPDEGQEYLPFEAVRDVLIREEATSLLGRLSPIFDLGIFSHGADGTSLNELLTTPTVIRLSQLPGDQVKNAVAEFFLMALYSFLIRREHPHRLERVLVLDEAWRLVQSPFLEPLMREGRAFGLGVVLATQFPKDLPDQIAGSTGTRLFFNQTKAEQVREIQRTLVGKTSGTEADHLGNLIRGLAPMECILQNLHYRPWVRLRAIPYFSLIAERQSQPGE